MPSLRTGSILLPSHWFWEECGAAVLPVSKLTFDYPLETRGSQWDFGWDFVRYPQCWQGWGAAFSVREEVYED